MGTQSRQDQKPGSIGQQVNAKQSPRGSSARYFNWKKKYSGMLPTGMKRLRALEDEDSRLTKIVANLMLDKEMLQITLKRKF